MPISWVTRAVAAMSRCGARTRNSDRWCAKAEGHAEATSRHRHNCPGNGNFADALSPVQILGGVVPDQASSTTGSFGVPGANRFGDAGRNTIRGPHLSNYDFPLFRGFAIKERISSNCVAFQ
jgi:hypothetical protein